jgi:hypothetical protein
MNAIITAATGYTEADLKVFLDSIELNCQNTKLFAIVYRRDREIIERLKLKYSFLEPIYVKERGRVPKKIFYWLGRFLGASGKPYSSVNSLLEFIGRFPLHIALDRYFVALQLVRSLDNSFSKILLTDSRDVFLQKNPFEAIDGDFVSGLEPITIGECPNYNSRWIREIYGNQVLQNILDKNIACSGVTLGTTEKIENYLAEMCNEIWRKLTEVNTMLGFDQAIHNYLIYHQKVVPHLVNNQSGWIATLQYEDPKVIIPDSTRRLIQLHGNLPAIIHQYDRHPKLVDLLKSQPELVS